MTAQLLRPEDWWQVKFKTKEKNYHGKISTFAVGLHFQI